jgi:hypothetical protein
MKSTAELRAEALRNSTGRDASLPEVQQAPFTQAEALAFQKAGEHIAKQHPGLVNGATSEEMAKAGFEMHPVVTATIVKRVKPEIVAWLLSPEGRGDAHALNNVKDDAKRSLEVLERIAGRVERQGDFAKPVIVHDEVSDYLSKRREAIRTGERRAR